MARLMITCPNTGEPVFTGIDLPESVLESAELRDNGVGCPHCGQTHVWSKEDAYLED
jgi:hypothetical protein